jgi:hypothetical protein
VVITVRSFRQLDNAVVIGQCLAMTLVLGMEERAGARGIEQQVLGKGVARLLLKQGLHQRDGAIILTKSLVSSGVGLYEVPPIKQ